MYEPCTVTQRPSLPPILLGGAFQLAYLVWLTSGGWKTPSERKQNKSIKGKWFFSPPRPSSLSLFLGFSKWQPRSMYLLVSVNKRLLCRLLMWKVSLMPWNLPRRWSRERPVLVLVGREESVNRVAMFGKLKLLVTVVYIWFIYCFCLLPFELWISPLFHPCVNIWLSFFLTSSLNFWIFRTILLS